MLKRLSQSATVNTWISLAIRMGGLVLLLPLVLTHFGVHEVLVWQLQSSIVAMLAWIDFGLTPTFSRFIAASRGGGKLADLLRTKRVTVASGPDEQPLDLGAVIGTLRRVNAAMALFGTVLVMAIGTAAIAGAITGLTHPRTGWMAWALTVLSVPFALINGSNTAVLIGSDRITALRRIESLVGLLQVLSTSLVVVLTSNLAMVAASYTFWGIVGFGLNRWQASRILTENGVQTEVFDPRIFRAAWAAGWRSGIGILFSTGLIQGSGMIMPQLAPPGVAASYLILLRIMSIGSQLSQAPFYSRLPAMAKANAEGQRAEVVAQAKLGMRLALWTMLAGIVALVSVAPVALTLIGSSVRIPDAGLSTLLGVAFFAERYGAMHMQLYTLSNHVIWHKVNGLTGLVGIAAFVLLWPFVGPMAVPLGMLVGYVGFLCPYMSHKSLQYFGLHRWHFERATSLLPALGLLACGTVVLVMRGLG